MSNEICTSMKTILGFAELILQQKTNPPLTQEYAFDIRRLAQNVLHSMNDVPDTSKSGAGKTEIVSEIYYTQRLLEDVSMVIADQAKEKGIEYRVTIEPTLPYRMQGAVSVIREILLGIMKNAVNNKHEGMLSLDVHGKWRTEKQICLEIVAEGAELGRANETGLIEQIDGEIQVESGCETGTRFTISLTQEIIDERPIGNLNLSFSDTEEKEFNQAFITTAKVLIVDDNQMNLKITAGLLQKYDINADIANSGYMAIDFIQENEYDLIFMDHMMPGMDGVETMLRIREMDKGKYGTLPIIVITANTLVNVKEDIMMLGFDGYLKKPIDVQKMERVLLKFIPKSKISYVNANVVDMSVPEIKVLEVSEADILQHMDVERGIQNCGGTLDDYHQVMDVVLRYGGKRLAKLKKLVNEKDYVNYIIDVHALKSTAANIGATELSQMASEHEQAGKIGDFGYIEANYEALLTLYTIVLKEIAAVRGKEISENAQEKFDGIRELWDEMSENDFIGEFETIEKSVKEHTSDYVETVPLQDTLSGAELRSLLDNVIEMLDDFEIDKAKDTLYEAVNRTKK